ncbi:MULTISPECIES: GDSL-type esterase/lipase family protein [unclassified Acidovorax]|uniref:GDSL-type esterase/lipase family protein n=1 Tax=unclassified Acidovorax TaxID=2684926 RepID=UPI0012FCAB46|nr:MULTISPECIES: GDSL-type esterase/lipase family protein [unclassified Acidovorax]
MAGLQFTHYPTSFYNKYVLKSDPEIKYSLERFTFHYLPETNKPRIAFLGDSIVEAANLPELLGRNDIVNRGISGDNSIWMQNRTKYLLSKKPKYLLIEGGINDINRKTPVKTILESKVAIVDFCKKNDIIPILVEVIPVTREPKAKLPASSSEINNEVKLLNQLIGEYSLKESIPLVHMTNGLSDGEYLKTELSTDGVHLNTEGYAFFRENILKVLAKLGA